MRFLSSLILILIFIISISIGFFLFSNPALAIKIQKKFYEKINWRIEPISMQRELRNIKVMGLFLIAMTLLTIAYALIFMKIV